MTTPDRYIKRHFHTDEWGTLRIIYDTVEKLACIKYKFKGERINLNYREVYDIRGAVLFVCEHSCIQVDSECAKEFSLMPDDHVIKFLCDGGRPVIQGWHYTYLTGHSLESFGSESVYNSAEIRPYQVVAIPNSLIAFEERERQDRSLHALYYDRSIFTPKELPKLDSFYCF